MLPKSILTHSLSDETVDFENFENKETPQRGELHDNRETEISIPLSSSQREAPASSVANTRETLRNRSILDLNNWISSSEDDSFTRELLKDLTPKRPNFHSLRNDSRSIINSSPVNEKISQPLESIPESHSPVQSSSRDPFPRPKRPKKLVFIKSDMSDPISSSSIVSSPVKGTLEQDKTNKHEGGKKKRNSTLKDKRTEEFTTKEWRDANKVTRKKEEILGEMIIEISLNLKSTVETGYFKEIFSIPKVRTTYFELPIISWKRRIKATYDRERDVFVPCTPKEISERIIVLYYEAGDLVNKINEDSLDETIQAARERANMEDPSLEYHFVVMVLGYREYLRKLQAVEHRRYKEHMLEKMQQPTTKKRHDVEQTISATEVQKLVIETEVKTKTNMFFPKSKEEAVDWLHSFTFAIGASLYDKHERNPQFANFGSVRLGTDRKSTFMEMTKRFSLMTHQKAERLYEYYTSVGALCKRLLAHEDLGTVNGKGIVPPSVSSAMRKLFRATDPDEVIVD